MKKEMTWPTPGPICAKFVCLSHRSIAAARQQPELFESGYCLEFRVEGLSFNSNREGLNA